MMDDVRLIAIGGSAGSLQPLLKIISFLKPGFNIPVLLVLHRNSAFASPLEELLNQRTSLKVQEVEEKEHIRSGVIYINPSDYHVLVERDHSFSLDASEKVNFSRPSIDVVFRSASEVYGERLVCILLSGANADGAEGLKVAKKNGGLIIVQDPVEAEVPFMPKEAIKRVIPDHILNTDQITGYLNSLI